MKNKQIVALLSLVLLGALVQARAQTSEQFDQVITPTPTSTQTPTAGSSVFVPFKHHHHNHHHPSRTPVPKVTPTPTRVGSGTNILFPGQAHFQKP
jgi:hypothetical protein